jgi:hypothetical protein
MAGAREKESSITYCSGKGNVTHIRVNETAEQYRTGANTTKQGIMIIEIL